MNGRVFQEMSLDKWAWSPSPLPGQVVLVTSRDAAGAIDVAPKSWVTIMGMTGPRIGFGCTYEHRTARNIRATGEFAISIPEITLARAIWRMPDSVDRLAGSELSLIPAHTIGVPLIAECLAHLECRLDRIVDLAEHEVFIIGVVQRFDMDEAALTPTTVADRYAAMHPFFFLEERWVAGLGAAESVAE